MRRLIDTKDVEVTYIRNGQKRTRKMPDYAIKSTLSTTFGVNYYNNLSLPCFIIKEDVELLHFKYLHCPEDIIFICLNKETTLILESCYFTRKESFENGNISIIEPYFIDNIINFNDKLSSGNNEMYFYRSKNIDLTLNNKNDKILKKIVIDYGENRILTVIYPKLQTINSSVKRDDLDISSDNTCYILNESNINYYEELIEQDEKNINNEIEKNKSVSHEYHIEKEDEKSIKILIKK